MKASYTSFGGIVDDARARWQAAENEAIAARLAALGNPDPEPSRRANALLKVADDLKKQFEAASAAHDEALAAPPLRTIDLDKVRRIREERQGTYSTPLSTLAILASPLAIAGLLVWRMR